MISFGLISFASNTRIASTASLHSANLSGSAAGVDELYGNERPMASIATAIVLAVYKPPHAPYKILKHVMVLFLKENIPRLDKHVEQHLVCLHHSFFH
jgi:hypothetical protein